MALSIGVGVGSKIDIGGHVLIVKSLSQPNLIIVTVDNGDDILISDKQSIQVLPEVYVQTGVSQKGSSGGNRLAFRAPLSIRISRMEK